MDDCTDVAGREAVLRQVNGQCHTIEFANHGPGSASTLCQFHS
jgi:hypothetical protein